jgi:hypothetical protein
MVSPDPLAQADAIAQVCHEANRAYCASIGDDSQKPWTDAPSWQRESAVEGVQRILLGMITHPHQAHDSWAAHKVQTGWTYGPVKDETKKEHHCLVPYAELPPEQQKKDALFFAIVNALK